MTKVTELKEARAEVLEAVKFKDDYSVSVKIFECWDDEEPTYDVEITWNDEDGEYIDCVSTDSFDNEKDALKRAKAVLKSVKGWLQYSKVEVGNNIETYRA